MGAGQPFMYDPVPKESSVYPYSSFDPKAVSRASLTPDPPKPKPDGPLVSFNKHPDSYLVLPCGNTDAKPMNPSVKKQVTVTRIVQLVLRCFELMGAIGLLVVVILITKMEPLTGWLMRIPPGVAILHTMYSICHLSRRPSGRTPASSASYMFFAAGIDVSLLPFYVFGALMASQQVALTRMGDPQDGEWDTLLPAGRMMMFTLVGMAFLFSVISGGLHLISLGISLWLAVTFHKIAKLPPDMNPLEDNLTSRHKRNKSSISIPTTSETRTSTPLESKRNSGAPYEDTSRPPTLPFLHTHTGSTESFSTYHSTPPPSRDSRVDLPSQQYQIPSHSNSTRSSIIDLKRSSLNYNGPPSPPKRASYTELPLSDTSSQRSSSGNKNIPEAWYTAESFQTSHRSSPQSPKKCTCQPLHQGQDSEGYTPPHPNPLEANPPTPRTPNHRPQRGSALSEISFNHGTGAGSGDLADMSRERDAKPQQPQQEFFKARFYGDLRAATPPVWIATANGRQVSSGNDFGNRGGLRTYDRRDVSGKIAEEGRSGAAWGARLRKISGL